MIQTVLSLMYSIAHFSVCFIISLTILILISMLLYFILMFCLSCIVMIFQFLKAGFTPTRANNIRRMSSRKMAEFILERYNEIGNLKGKFNSVSALEEWLNCKE